MKRIILIMICCLLPLIMASGQEQQAQKLMSEAIYQEEVNGDLDKAIKTYQVIINQYRDNRKVSAEALLHLGMCYEKLGNQEAVKTYRQLVSNFPEQKNEVAVAREHLSRLIQVAEKLSKAPLVPAFTKIKMPGNPGNGMLSPDGKKIAFISEGDVWVVPVSGGVNPFITGEPKRLTNDIGAWDMNNSFCWSGNGKWIAFNAERGKISSTTSIYVIPSEGGEAQKVQVPSHYCGWPGEFRLSLSPDGKTLAYVSGWKDYNNKSGQIFIIPVNGDEAKELTEPGTLDPAWSPDGNMIAYVKSTGSYGKDEYSEIFVIPAGGGDPKLLVNRQSGQFSGPVWSPDGKMIAFNNWPHSGIGTEIWLVQVINENNPVGTLRKVDPPLESYHTIAGWTPDNKIGLQLTNLPYEIIYTVPSKGGIATQVTPQGWTSYPKWSPDGKRIYFRWDGGQIASVPAEGGPVDSIKIDSEFNIITAVPGSGNELSPDGKTIVFSGAKNFNKDGKKQMEVDIFTIPVEGGKPKQLTEIDFKFQDRFPCWSPDGNSIAFIRPEIVDEKFFMHIYTISRDGENLRRITERSDDVAYAPIDWTPDGKAITFFAKNNTICSIPVEGGGSTSITKVDSVNSQHELAWSPDGKELAYTDKGKIWIFDPGSGITKEVKTGVTANATKIGWSPDGSKIAFTAFAGGDADLWLMENFLPLEKLGPEEEKESKPNLRKIEIATEPKNGVLSPDGKKLAFTSENGVWLVPLQGNVGTDIAGEPVRLAEVPGVTNFYNVLSWTADGRWIAVNGGGDGADDVYIVPIDGGETRKISLPKRGAGYLSSRLSLSPDGEKLAFSALKQGLSEKKADLPALHVYIVSTKDGEPRQISSGPGTYPSFSPDGQFIAYVAIHEKEKPAENIQGARYYSDLWVVDSSGGTPVKLAIADGLLAGPIWSPDGRFIAATGRTDIGGKEIWIYPLSPDRSSVGKPTIIALPGYSIGMLTGWTPENELGVFIRSEYRSAVYTVPSSGGRAVQVTPEGIVYYPRWSLDGKRIYLRWVKQDEDPPVQLVYVPAIGGDVTKIPWPGNALTSRVPGGGHNISPDGRKIVVSAVKRPSGPEETMDLRVIPLDDGLPVRLTDDESHETYPCWSPDGEWIAFVDWHKQSDGRGFDAIYRIPAEGGQAMIVSSPKDSIGFGAIAFSPDGNRIAFFSEGAIKTIPVEGGEPEVLVAEVQSSRHTQLDWSPDGTKIAYNAEGKIWITTLATGEKTDLKTGLPEDFYASEFDWSPDGEKITFMTTSGDEPELWLISDFLPQAEKK